MQSRTPLIMKTGEETTTTEGCNPTSDNDNLDGIITTVRRQATELYSRSSATQPFPAGTVIVHGNITLSGLQFKYDDDFQLAEEQHHVTGSDNNGNDESSADDVYISSSASNSQQLAGLKLPGLRYAFLGKRVED